MSYQRSAHGGEGAGAGSRPIRSCAHVIARVPSAWCSRTSIRPESVAASSLPGARTLSPDQIAVLDDLLGDDLRRFGYHSLEWPVEAEAS